MKPSKRILEITLEMYEKEGLDPHDVRINHELIGITGIVRYLDEQYELSEKGEIAA